MRQNATQAKKSRSFTVGVSFRLSSYYSLIKSGLCKHFRDFRPPDEKVTHEQAALNSEAECDNVG